MAVMVNVVGEKAAALFLAGRQAKAEVNSKGALVRAAIFLQGEVKLSIAGKRAEKKSVDTGRFLNSIDFNLGSDDAIVFTDLDYAKGLEFGSSRLAPRKHFTNSRLRSQPKIIQIFKDAMS